MVEHNSIERKEEKIIDIERKDGILEELNLPPHVIKFIRDNSRNLQIAAACIVLVVLGWTYYDYHIQVKENNAAAALNAAVQEVDDAARGEQLQKVATEFSGTDAARWSRIEQGHLAFKGGDYDAALVIYNEILDDLDDDSPLLPLLVYNIGLAHENSGAKDQALKYYARLAEYKGFEVKGLMSQGRIYELKGEDGEALRVYREASAKKEVTGLDKSILTEKINTLQGVEPVAESS